MQSQVSSGFPIGWTVGTSGAGTPPNYLNGRNNVPCWSLTTIKYAPGTREFVLPGISPTASGNQNFGPNNPLISTHTGGVQCAPMPTVNGSVRFVNNDIELFTLRCLVTRDDADTNQGF